jgi:hypothetical protein
VLHEGLWEGSVLLAPREARSAHERCGRHSGCPWDGGGGPQLPLRGRTRVVLARGRRTSGPCAGMPATLAISCPHRRPGPFVRPTARHAGAGGARLAAPHRTHARRSGARPDPPNGFTTMMKISATMRNISAAVPARARASSMTSASSSVRPISMASPKATEAEISQGARRSIYPAKAARTPNARPATKRIVAPVPESGLTVRMVVRIAATSRWPATRRTTISP